MPVERPSAAQSLIGWLMVLVWIVSVISLVVRFPWALGVIALLVIVGIHLQNVEKERRTALARERDGESLCTFVRSFDYRTIDTWILRAVYEELQSYFGTCPPIVPIRADDDIDRMLGIDPEELEYLLTVIAYRCGRSIDVSPDEASLVRIQTVSDLVRFLTNQPRQNEKKPLSPDHWALDV